MTPPSGEDDAAPPDQPFRGETTTIDITRTIRLQLETSAWKVRRIDHAIDEWQRVARYAAEVLPSFPPYRWDSRDTQLRRVVRSEIDDLDIYAHDRDAAVAKAREAFDAWHERGRPGDRPMGQFGDAEYYRMSTSSSSKQRRELVENNRGIGLRVSLLKSEDEPLWFHARLGEYQREWIDKVLADKASLGTVELHRGEGDSLWAHVSISEPVEIYEPADVDTVVGVDLGERVLYAAAVVTDGAVEAVDIESGREFRHYRERLDSKRDRLAEQGDLAGVRATKGDRRRYTEQETHTASRQIVDLAAAHAPCLIRLEDLSGYRETATDPIHDWPHGMLAEQIAYKAREARIPVEAVDPSKTSITCRRCGATNPAFRSGNDFRCGVCGYEVHADLNAAVNIAMSE
jgi:IS605 OrfB family transposase